MLAGIGMVVGSAISNPATAQTKNTNTYYCAQLNNSWNTFVNTPRGQSQANCLGEQILPRLGLLKKDVRQYPTDSKTFLMRVI